GETLSLARRAGARVREVPDRHLRRRGARAANADAAFAKAQELLTVGSRDDEPFATVVRRTGAGRRGEAASLATEFVRGFYLADPRTASSLALARMTRAIEETGDAIGRVDGGYARVLEPLVRDVRANRGELRLSTVVDELRWRRGHVRVAARGLAGARLRPIEADRAVVTLPLSLLKDGDVRFVPALREKGRAAAALAMGPIVKVLLRFRWPPWRDAGRRALAFLHVAGAPVPVFWTLAPLEAPVLVGWAGGPDAERLAGRREADVVRAAIRSAARGLGLRAGALEEALDGAAVADWTRDPFARGGYAVFPAGSAGAAEVLAEGIAGTLFFAGEATAGARAGTVDGAIMTGERAAREVLASR
ncbi:MAG TPA: NAD(P)/FAD-dependent oxidoreductase, partial [Anaeromyxobacter sp.]|nr:NAD(P)/FAD-dependent oxidoreductase [Anaeromyxobacter sp.]